MPYRNPLSAPADIAGFRLEGDGAVSFPRGRLRLGSLRPPEDGQNLFDLAPRTGPYEQYHHGDLNAYHVSYFRRRWPAERQLHTCNLRKSYGFHLVAQGPDPLPAVLDAQGPYRMCLTVHKGEITFEVAGLESFRWRDDAPLPGGRIGFRQMAPMIGEYADLRVTATSGKAFSCR